MISNNADHDTSPISTLIPPTNNQLACTRLYHARQIGAYYGFSRRYLKLEGVNPSGTQKDRVAAQVIVEARARAYCGMTVTTCGNFGAALARVCAAQLPCQIFIPQQYTCERVPEMLDCGAIITYICGSYEEAVMASQEYARQTSFYDANPSGIGGETALNAYREIAFEVLDDPGETLASLWVVVGRHYAGRHLSRLQAAWHDAASGSSWQPRQYRPDRQYSAGELRTAARFHQHGEHKNLYDFELLSWVLQTTGFVNIRQVAEAGRPGAEGTRGSAPGRPAIVICSRARAGVEVG